MTAATPTLAADQAYAAAQLVKLSNLPSGWSKSGSVQVGTSDDQNSISMLTATQLPELSTCLGVPAPLSVTAAEATSPVFDSKDENTIVLDIADVYQTTADAKADFPPFSNPKFAACFLQVQGPVIAEIEKSEWEPGTTFGTPTASTVRAPRYGNQSGMVQVTVPVTFSNGDQTSDYFDVLAIRQGRSTAELYINNANVPPSLALVRSLSKTVTAKMKARPPKTKVAV